MRLAADSAFVYKKWWQLVEHHSVQGVQVHDARLVAAMLVHGIPKLLTLNTADFGRYTGLIAAVHPRSLKT
jgi:hypothetical protein